MATACPNELFGVPEAVFRAPPPDVGAFAYDRLSKAATKGFLRRREWAAERPKRNVVT